MSTRPIIGVPACRKPIDIHPFHVVGEKYLQAVIDGANALPLMIPVMAEHIDVEELLQQVDGVFLTGSLSNVEPHHYAGEPSDPGTLHDPQRDATTLPLARAVLEAGVPLMAVCRGYQELVVALGGTLHHRGIFVVIIIVLNLIFGVIIDTFADLRSEKQKKEEILKNTCFICGE